jgi:hypothetical protein
VFTARYALSPYLKEIRFVFKGLITRPTSCKLTKELEKIAKLSGLILVFLDAANIFGYRTVKKEAEREKCVVSSTCCNGPYNSA